MREYHINKYCGFCRKFQGIGFIISFDRPTYMHDNNFSAEIIFLWFKAWVVVQYSDKADKPRVKDTEGLVRSTGAKRSL